MDGREFYDKVDAHPDLEFLGSKLGVSPALDRVFIGCRGRNKLTFEISPAGILDPLIAWEDLEPVLTGRRPPKVLAHLTRIVGYYSNLKAWNGSKLAELADRQRGDYGVPARDGAWPAGMEGLPA